MTQVSEDSELLDAINRHVITFLDSNEFSLDNLSSWNCPLHSGKESTFRGRVGTPNARIQLSVTITVYASDGAAVVNIFRLDEGARELLEAFVPNVNKINSDVRESLAKALTKCGVVKLPQLMQILLIREAILNNLEVKDFLKLEASSQLLKDVCGTREVDNGFWRKALKKKYDIDTKETTYRAKYASIAKERKQAATEPGSSLLIDQRFPRRHPDPVVPDPFNPDYPDPMGPFNPLGPLRPRRPNPDPFGPDPLNPFGDPFGPGSGTEIFPGRNQPRHGPRGGPPGGFGPAGWPQFDRNDFI